MSAAYVRTILLVMALLCALWGPPARAQDKQEGIAIVVERVAPAEYRHAGESNWQEVSDGGTIILGDSLKTGSGGRIKLIFNDRSILILSENTSLNVTEHVYDPDKKRRKSLFKLYEGKVRAIVGELFGANSRFEIETPVAVAGVKGTDYDTEHKDPCSTVYTNLGAVKARNSDAAIIGEVTVPDGYLTVVCKGKPPTAPVVASEDFIKKTVPLRSNRTVKPEPPPDDGGSKPPGPEPTPPKFPPDNGPSPTDLGGLPPGPPVFPPPPAPIVNNTLN